MRQELVLCRGIPASGKSTWSKAWVKVSSNRARVSRDDIRFNLFDRYIDVDEKVVTSQEDKVIDNLLKNGYSVVVDDCNIDQKFVSRLAKIGHKYGVTVWVMQFDVDPATAKARNKARDRVVPDNVIDSMYSRLQKTPLVSVEPEDNTYVRNYYAQSAIIVDIDGTLADRNNGNKNVRSPFDWNRVDEDAVVHEVADVVSLYYQAGYEIIVMSGRDSSCRKQTEDWLSNNGVLHHHLYMRPEGDLRADYVVKRELFDNHIRHKYNVHVALDDRDQVVELWRSLGIACFQVAPSFD